MADDRMKADGMSTSKSSEQRQPNPDDSPFELQAVEGMPFDDDSDEARAIRAVIEAGDRERAARRGR